MLTVHFLMKNIQDIKELYSVVFEVWTFYTTLILPYFFVGSVEYEHNNAKTLRFVFT